jgi:hypothetical protein
LRSRLQAGLLGRPFADLSCDQLDALYQLLQDHTRAEGVPLFTVDSRERQRQQEQRDQSKTVSSEGTRGLAKSERRRSPFLVDDEAGKKKQQEYYAARPSRLLLHLCVSRTLAGLDDVKASGFASANQLSSARRVCIAKLER